MYETEEELSKLSSLVEATKTSSKDRESPVFGQGEWLSGRQLVHHLSGIATVALATVNHRGEPRVAPFDAALIHGRFYMPIGSESYRIEHVRSNPVASIAYAKDEDALIIADGVASIVSSGSEEFSGPDAEWSKKYERSLPENIVFVRLEPTHLVAIAINPELFPSI